MHKQSRRWRKILFTHADINERMNAAYAIARLLDKKEERSAIGGKLMADDALVWCRFPLRRGMIEAGDDAGVAFLSLKHLGQAPGRPMYPTELIFHLKHRLEHLQRLREPEGRRLHPRGPRIPVLARSGSLHARQREDQRGPGFPSAEG